MSAATRTHYDQSPRERAVHDLTEAVLGVIRVLVPDALVRTVHPDVGIAGDSVVIRIIAHPDAVSFLVGRGGCVRAALDRIFSTAARKYRLHANLRVEEDAGPST